MFAKDLNMQYKVLTEEIQTERFKKEGKIKNCF